MRGSPDSHRALDAQVDLYTRLLQGAEGSESGIKSGELMNFMAKGYTHLVDTAKQAGQKAGVKVVTPFTTAEDWCWYMAYFLARADTYYVAPHMVDVIGGTQETLPNFRLTADGLHNNDGFVYLPHTPHPLSDEDKEITSELRAFQWGLTHVSRIGTAECGSGAEDKPIYGLCKRCGHRHLNGVVWTAYGYHGLDVAHTRAPDFLIPLSCGTVALGDLWDIDTVKIGAAGFDDVKLSDAEKAEIDQIPTNFTRRSLQFFVAFLCFLQQKCVMQVEQKAPRATRRRLEAQHWGTEPLIRTVLLRKYVEESERKGHGDVDWTCKWWVKGHWRLQWYPSLQTWIPIFIAPYLKGPEDKPLKPPTKTLYDVMR